MGDKFVIALQRSIVTQIDFILITLLYETTELDINSFSCYDDSRMQKKRECLD